MKWMRTKVEVKKKMPLKVECCLNLKVVHDPKYPTWSECGHKIKHMIRGP